MSTKFLDVSDVIAIHQQILEYGGASGIRSMELLQSAVAIPSSGFGDEYFHRSIYEMAAAYLYHIVKNHPFVDGNKRVGLMAAYVFLEM